MRVEPGEIVRTGYVPIHRVRLGCKARMAVGDIDRAFQKSLQIGSSSAWPPPNGHWEKDEQDGVTQFVICDGRHEYISKLMLGFTHIFVAWKEKTNAGITGSDS